MSTHPHTLPDTNLATFTALGGRVVQAGADIERICRRFDDVCGLFERFARYDAVYVCDTPPLASAKARDQETKILITREDSLEGRFDIRGVQRRSFDE